MKDHEIAALVNELTKVAQEFGQTQQLRERISQLVVPALKTAPIPVEEYLVKYKDITTLNMDEKYGYESCRYEFMVNGGMLRKPDRDAFELFYAQHWKSKTDKTESAEELATNIKSWRVGDVYGREDEKMNYLNGMWTMWQKALS